LPGEIRRGLGRENVLHDEAELARRRSPTQIRMVNAGPAGPVDLRERGIDESQAADLRRRLTPFAEDWDRPEMAAYDELPPG